MFYSYTLLQFKEHHYPKKCRILIGMNFFFFFFYFFFADLSRRIAWFIKRSQSRVSNNWFIFVGLFPRQVVISITMIINRHCIIFKHLLLFYLNYHNICLVSDSTNHHSIHFSIHFLFIFIYLFFFFWIHLKPKMLFVIKKYIPT
jgi:hypothetical protein